MFLASAAAALTSASAGVAGAIGAGLTGLGTFLSSGFGSLLLSVGGAAINYLLNKPEKPKTTSARVNVRIGEPERWLHFGRSRVAGAAMFGEYDNINKAFWIIIVHGDSELMNTVSVLGDEIPLEIEDNMVTGPKEFTRTLKASGSSLYRIWTTTFKPDDPVPPFPVTSLTPDIQDFQDYFPEWTEDHKLAGTTFSVIRVRNLPADDRYKCYTWRGIFGLGEPTFSIVGDWGRIYDPRPGALNYTGGTGQDINDQNTWISSRNPALIWAAFRTHPYGMNKSMDSINWEKVAEQADICDEDVLDKNGNTHKRYICGISIPDSKERGDAEQEILMTADAIIMHDSAGLAYPMVGKWYEPTLELSANRDIFTMSSREAEDGESETDGVIVKYIDQDFGWIEQPCAAWKNPLYYVDGKIPKYLTVEILGCQDHNQAVRLAKAIGLRSQSAYRLAPTIGLRGLMMRKERILNLVYDSHFSGYQEIVTPVELDESGQMTAAGLVPIDADRWTLLFGEEGDKPAPVVSITDDDTLPDAGGVTISAVPVEGSGGSTVRLEATFDAPTREDFRYEFQYRKQGTTAWRIMIVNMDELLAYSDTVENTAIYEVQYRTVAVSGRAGEWKSPPVEVAAIADPTPTSPPTELDVTVDSHGIATISFRAPNSANVHSIHVWRALATDSFVMATDISGEIGTAPNALGSYIDNSPVPGPASYKYWATAHNGSDLASSEAGPVTITAGHANRVTSAGDRRVTTSGDVRITL